MNPKYERALEELRDFLGSDCYLDAPSDDTVKIAIAAIENVLADEERVIDRFLRSLSVRTEAGVRVSDATIRKLRALAVEKGFLPNE